MNNLFQEFPSVDLADWKDKIVKDLKGKELSVLDFHDPIEDIDFRAFYHREERNDVDLTPGSFPATRGSKSENNQWSNGAYILVNDEKTANKKALEFLMMGADMLFFKAEKTVNWNQVLDGVQLEYIETQFNLASTAQVNEILTLAGNAKSQISFCFDPVEQPNLDFPVLPMKDIQIGTYSVNGFGVQRCGGNTWQEIAFCLSVGHNALHKLMEAGLTVDQAAAQVHFHVGIGANYFNEIGKLRALHQLWSKVVSAYHPQKPSSYDCKVTAVIGHTNKSLRDPYTNLLRQTTETMAAASSADAVLVLPYDLYSADGSSDLAARMALNISTLLKEESYLHHVIDAPGGSYTIEQLTEKIGRKAWKLFQEMESTGGIANSAAIENFKSKVEKTATKRYESYANGDQTLIGVNKFPDPNEKDTQWKSVPGYIGLQSFLADTIQKTETV